MEKISPGPTLAVLTVYALGLLLGVVAPGAWAGDSAVGMADGTIDLLEDFEDEGLFDLPTAQAEWYTFDEIGSGVNVVKDDGTGNQAWSSTVSGFPTRFLLNINYDLCSASELSFRFKYAATTGQQTIAIFKEISDNFFNDGLYLIQATGTTTWNFRLSAGTTANSANVGLSVDTWYTVIVRDIGCGPNATTRVIIPEIEFVQTLSVTGEIAQGVYFGRMNVAGSGPEYWIDDFIAEGVEDTPLSIGAAETSAVSGLVGFDVDDTGNTIITREDSGQTVKVYSATTLDVGPNVVDTDCNQADSVAATRTHVTFLQCDTGGAVDTLSIRAANLGSPDFSAVCDEGEFCYADIATADLDGDQGLVGELAELRSFPWTFRECGLASENHCFLSWGFSTNDGRMGAVTLTMRNNAPDRSDIATINVDSSGANAVNQVCGFTGTDNKDYLYGASASSNTIGARVDYTVTDGFFSGGADLEVAMSAVFTGTASTASPEGVACGVDRFLVSGGSGRVSAWERGSASPVWFIDGVQADASRSVAVSYDGRWGAYKDQTTINIISMDNGTRLGTIEVPAGSWHSMSMDETGQNLWVATSTQITRYEVFTVTTGSEVASTGGSGGTPTIGGGGQGETAIVDVDSLAGQLGFDAVATGWILGLFLMVMGAAAGAIAPGRFRGVAVTVGIVAGAGFATGLGFLPFWFILVMGVVAAAVLLGIGRR